MPASQRWTNTGFTVQQGQPVRFSATGQVILSQDNNDTATPAGSTTGRYAGGAPSHNVLAGALIGRIGNGAPFGIGGQTQALPMPGSGQLFLGVNDDNLNDNRGEFRVQVIPEGGGRGRRDERWAGARGQSLSVLGPRSLGLLRLESAGAKPRPNTENR